MSKKASETYNAAVSKFMHPHLLKDANPEKYKSTLLEIISLCQESIGNNPKDGDAHIILANCLYLCSLPPLPGNYYTYFLPLAGAVIFHWRQQGLHSEEKQNGEILFDSIREAINAPGEYWGEAKNLPTKDLSTLHERFYLTATKEGIEFPVYKETNGVADDSKTMAELQSIFAKWKHLNITSEAIAICRYSNEMGSVFSSITDLFFLCRSSGTLSHVDLLEIEIAYQDLIEPCIKNALLLGIEFQSRAPNDDQEKFLLELKFVQQMLEPFLKVGLALWMGSYRKKDFNAEKFKEIYMNWATMVVGAFWQCSLKAKELVKA